MPCPSSLKIPRPNTHLRRTSTIPLRSLPRLPRPVPTQCHPYSTHPPHPPAPAHRPNYKAAILCTLTAAAATWAVARRKPERLDAPLSSNGSDALTSGARVEITGKGHGSDSDQIPTGTSTIPYFPRTIWVPRSGSASEQGKSPALPAGVGAAREEEEYQLLGLGVRKVSFLKIQVYVVGVYVARDDMGRLQEELVRAAVGSGASTLVQGEKEELKKTLLDGEGSTKVWSEVLRDGGVRSAVRVVPTRNTSFGHMRDGWIRGIEMRGKGEEFEDGGFKGAVDQFKAMLGGRGSVGKGKVLLLGRGASGGLRAWVEGEAGGAEGDISGGKGGGMMMLGTIGDERVSRLVWMGYLAGQNVASEEARRSVVDGVIEMVERPLGTIETQVV